MFSRNSGRAASKLVPQHYFSVNIAATSIRKRRAEVTVRSAECECECDQCDYGADGVDGVRDEAYRRRTGGVQAYMASTDVGIASSLRRFSSFSLLRCAVTRLAAVASHFARALIFTLLFALHSPYLFTPLLCYSACCCPDAASHSCALIFSLLFTRLSSYLFTPLARTLLPFTSQPNIAFNLNRETDA